MQGGAEIYEIAKKYSLVILAVFSGVAAKIATENEKKKITISQIWVTILTGLFSCFIAGALCAHYVVEYYLSVGIIGVSAMNGQNICGWIITHSNSLMTTLYKLLINKKNK